MRIELKPIIKILDLRDKAKKELMPKLIKLKRKIKADIEKTQIKQFDEYIRSAAEVFVDAVNIIDKPENQNLALKTLDIKDKL